MELEREYKRMLSEREFQLLKAWCRQNGLESEGSLHANTYYDTNDLELFRGEHTLRLRKTGGTIYAQFKCLTGRDSGVRICTEYECEIVRVPREIKLDVMFPNCPVLTKTPCVRIGELLTNRCRFSGQGYTLFLDVNFYLGAIDYELEVEFEPGVSPEVLPEELRTFGEPAVKSKYQRFIDWLIGTKANPA